MALTPDTRGPRNLSDRLRCTAHTRQSAGVDRCTNPRNLGATVCRMHGGGAPQVKRAAARRLAADKVRRSMADVEVREIDNPLAELRALTGEVIAWKDALASHVAYLGGAALSADTDTAADLHAHVALYERALDRAGKFLGEWVRLGIDAMLADLDMRFTVEQAKVWMRGLAAYRTAAGVGEKEDQAGRTAMAKVLRLGPVDGEVPE